MSPVWGFSDENKAGFFSWSKLSEANSNLYYKSSSLGFIGFDGPIT